MTLNSYEYLCYNDKRNPLHYSFDDDEPPTPRKGCACYSRFYGRDKLGLRIIELTKTILNPRKL